MVLLGKTLANASTVNNPSSKPRNIREKFISFSKEEYQIRNQQVHTRAAELIAVLRLVFILAQ